MNGERESFEIQNSIEIVGNTEIRERGTGAIEVLGKFSELSSQKFGGADARPTSRRK